MIYDRLRVFVSSKMAELAPERAAIKAVLDELNIDAWVFEQDAGARPETIQESYTEELDAADLYVGVFWKGFGDYTLDEYERAQAAGKDCLVYQKGGNDVPDRDSRLQDFLNQIGRVETGLTVQFFETAEELREMVKRDAARWQMRIVRKYRESGPRRTTTGLPADPNLAILRHKVQQFWIEGVLGRSMDAGLIDLAREHRRDSEDQHWEAILELPYEGSRVVEPEASLVDVFDELQGSLLVLGQPGSGKTTTVLQLARELIERSERDASQPVPVMLNLSAWSANSTSLLSWITKEISSKYQIPRRVSRPWLELGRLVLILDGLDEVSASMREACVLAINRFCSEHGLAGLIVTCRLEEYDALSVRLRTNGAVCLQPLGPAQIEAFLDEAGTEVEGLRNVLKTDEVLRALARSPLMLSVMKTAYRGRTAAELEKEAGTAEERRAHLFEAYVDRAFEMGASPRSYSREATTAWLSRLAKRMAARNQTVFLIEEIQPSWLARRAELGGYLVGLAVLFGLVFGGLCILYRLNPSAVLDCPDVVEEQRTFGRVVWLSRGETLAWIIGCTVWFLGVGLTDGLPWRAVKPDESGPVDYKRVLASVVLFGLLWVPIMVVFVGVVEIPDGRIPNILSLPIALTLGASAFCARRSLSRSIRTTESLELNWTRAGRGVLWGLPIGLGFGAIGYFFLSGRDPGALVFWALITAAFGALLAGLVPQVVRGKTVPNQGMMFTIRTSLRSGRSAILLAATVVATCFVRGGEYWRTDLVVIWAAVTFVFFFTTLAMWFGGLDFGKHWLVRGLIGFTRQGPYDFARLLGDASRRNLMRRVGGGFLFAHRLLRDHFAAMDLPTPERGDLHVEDDGPRRVSAALVAMTTLAAGGLTLLLIGLAKNSRTAIALGAIALGIGAQWLVVRTAVTSALDAAQRDENVD